MDDPAEHALMPQGNSRLAPVLSEPASADQPLVLRLNNILQLLTNCAWFIGTPFIPLYLVAHGASAGTVGVVAGLSGIVPLAVALHVGSLVDERGPTLVLVGSVVLFGLGAVMLAAFGGIPEVTVAYTLMILSNIGLAVASQAVVATMSTDATRIRNYGYYAVAYSAGAVVGPVIGGFLATRFGYPAAFLTMALLMLPSLAVAAMLRPGPGLFERAARTGAIGRTIGLVWGERGVPAILFVSGIMQCAQALQSTFYPLYLLKVGLSAMLIGVAIAAMSVSSMAVRVFLAGAVDWLGQTGALVAAMALSGVAFVITPFVRPFWALLGVSGLMGAGLGFTQPLSMSLLAETVAQEFWGAAFGIRQSVQRAFGVVSPFVFGAASAARGVEAAFAVGAVVLFGAAGFTARLFAGARFPIGSVAWPSKRSEPGSSSTR